MTRKISEAETIAVLRVALEHLALPIPRQIAMATGQAIDSSTKVRGLLLWTRRHTAAFTEIIYLRAPQQSASDDASAPFVVAHWTSSGPTPGPISQTGSVRLVHASFLGAHRTEVIRRLHALAHGINIPELVEERRRMRLVHRVVAS
jgi:hypothetical protein